jgi:AraC-like DNA-binding protein
VLSNTQFDSDVPLWLARVRARVAESCRRPPSRAELALQAGVDVAHLSRAFRAHFGTTIMGFARARRLADALRWLAWTDEPVAAVAKRCGYSDQGHLARECRRHTGMTPAAFRRAAVVRGMARAS